MYISFNSSSAGIFRLFQTRQAGTGIFPAVFFFFGAGLVFCAARFFRRRRFFRRIFLFANLRGAVLPKNTGGKNVIQSGTKFFFRFTGKSKNRRAHISGRVHAFPNWGSAGKKQRLQKGRFCHGCPKLRFQLLSAGESHPVKCAPGL